MSPERLTDDQVAIHRAILERAGQADAMRAAIAESDAVVKWWSGHLATAHDLSPGDTVEVDGTIRREARPGVTSDDDTGPMAPANTRTHPEVDPDRD